MYVRHVIIVEDGEVLLVKICSVTTVASRQLVETFVNEEEAPTYTRSIFSSIDMPAVNSGSSSVLIVSTLDFTSWY
jgi:hypothetical protein